jgi:hypothetical protein
MADDLSSFLSQPSPQPPEGAAPKDVLNAYQKEGQTAVDVAQKKGAAQADYTRQEGQYMQGIQKKFEGQYQEAPEFKPTPQSKEDLMGLFGILGAIGALAGGKSYGSALGAMNAMGGMLNGYQEGRKDLFDREKTEFDKHLQSVKAHNDQITQAFNQAMNMAPYNLSKAKAKLQQDLSTLDAQMLKAQVERQGIEKTAQMFETANDKFLKKMLIDAQTFRAIEQGITAKSKAEGTQGEGVGAVARLSDLAGTPANVKPKEAETILQRLYTLNNTLQLLEEAKDPAIKFGELGRAGTNFTAAIQRNVKPMEGQQVSPSEMANAVETAAQEAGLNPNDKNVVFYKKAIFSAMALEREARGGSILPQGMFNRLTPLFDPSKTTKDAFIGIMQDRAREVGQASGLTTQQLGSALTKLQSQKMPFDISKSLSPGDAPKPSGKPTIQQFLEKAKQANPGASDQELTEYYNKKYGGQ